MFLSGCFSLHAISPQSLTREHSLGKPGENDPRAGENAQVGNPHNRLNCSHQLREVISFYGALVSLSAKSTQSLRRYRCDNMLKHIRSGKWGSECPGGDAHCLSPALHLTGPLTEVYKERYLNTFNKSLKYLTHAMIKSDELKAQLVLQYSFINHSWRYGNDIVIYILIGLQALSKLWLETSSFNVQFVKYVRHTILYWISNI